MLSTQNLTVAAEKLAAYYVTSSDRFEPVTQRIPYYHMGATITDAILQAGMNYQTVVYPRVLNLLQNYADFKTTCDFLILMQTIKLEDLINWKNKRKLQNITQLSWLFQEFNVQTEGQLKLWLEHDQNLDVLLQINGIGPKTIDYLKMLSGCQSIAIDRHLFKYLRLSGIAVSTYSEAHTIYSSAADLLGITPYEFDKSIWNAMSKGLA